MDGDVFHETEAGTPQGGCISPLLANIALHELEEALKARRTLKNGKTVVTREGMQYDNRGRLTGKRAVVRYADDFVVFCESEADAERVITLLTGWLKERGLALSPEKTRLVHLSAGFDFLGFNVRLYKAEQTAKTGRKLLIKPSKKSVQKIRDKLRDE